MKYFVVVLTKTIPPLSKYSVADPLISNVHHVNGDPKVLRDKLINFFLSYLIETYENI